mmetsp:Transcript_43625/g.120714  ORF Transcript_43625/g.120714 Transcript_43625/m.120714 type:complete len:280 (+) Transcript_43625:159-998(+)
MFVVATSELLLRVLPTPHMAHAGLVIFDLHPFQWILTPVLRGPVLPLGAVAPRRLVKLVAEDVFEAATRHVPEDRVWVDIGLLGEVGDVVHAPPGHVLPASVTGVAAVRIAPVFRNLVVVRGTRRWQRHLSQRSPRLLRGRLHCHVNSSVDVGVTVRFCWDVCALFALRASGCESLHRRLRRYPRCQWSRIHVGWRSGWGRHRRHIHHRGAPMRLLRRGGLRPRRVRVLGLASRRRGGARRGRCMLFGERRGGGRHDGIGPGRAADWRSRARTTGWGLH